MALTVEDGTGVTGAESYISVADANAYWNKRQHDAFFATWDAAETASKEGALRAATQYLDAFFGQYYRGTRKNYTQGLEWPRNGELDEDDEDEDGDTTDYLPVRDSDGIDLPSLPPQIQWATAEVAVRALDRGYIVADNATGQRVRFKKLDVIETQYFDDGSNLVVNVTFGYVAHILSPIISGGSPQGMPAWNWR